MGILSRWGLVREVSSALDSPPKNSSYSVATPFSGPSHLTPAIVYNDIFGLKQTAVTRAEAMSIPAVAKARALIVGMSRYPLRAYKGETLVPDGDQPSWTYRTDGIVSPRMRMIWTLDDLLFYGWSLWATKRGADDAILDFSRVPKNWWKFDAAGQVLINDKPANGDEVVLIPGPVEGLLENAARTIRGARQLEEQWSSRVKNPVPVVEIRYTGDEDISTDEMTDIRDTYITARNDENGVVMVTPRGFEVHPHGDQALDLFVEGRNAVSLDVARFANVPANLLDASNTNASSVTYASSLTDRNWFLDTTYRGWALAPEERLSMDDVVPRGHRVGFDFSALREPDTGTGPALQD